MSYSAMSVGQLLTIRWWINKGYELHDVRIVAGTVYFEEGTQKCRILRDGTVEKHGGWATYISRADMGRAS